MQRKSKTDPQILEMPPQKMAVVQGKGAPDKVFAEVMPALYGSVYTLKFDLKKRGLSNFKVSPPRARYPDGLAVPMNEWTIITGVPVPEDTISLPQKVPGIEVKLHTGTMEPLPRFCTSALMTRNSQLSSACISLLMRMATELPAPMKKSTSLSLMPKSRRPSFAILLRRSRAVTGGID